MEAIDYPRFCESTEAFDALAIRTPDVDAFCSSSDWVLPAHEALAGAREPWLFAGAEGFLAFALGQNDNGPVVAQPLESSWLLGAPLVGERPDRLAGELAILCKQHARVWDLLLVSGLASRSHTLGQVAEKLDRFFVVHIGPLTRRMVADLDGGVDGFLGRRSRNMRRSLRRAMRRAVQAGISFEFHPGRGATELTADELYRRILAVEFRSWKGLGMVGIQSGPMELFYRLMLRRLVVRGGHRVIFARHQDRDIGYVLGGMLGDTYRGLQFSYDQAYGRYSLGGLLQLEQVEMLCAEQIAWYDMGVEIAYKRRWTDRIIETASLVALNPSGSEAHPLRGEPRGG